MIHFIFTHLIKQLQKVCQNFEVLANYLIWNFDVVLFWLGIQYESIVLVTMGWQEVSSEHRHSSCSSYSTHTHTRAKQSTLTFTQVLCTHPQLWDETKTGVCDIEVEMLLWCRHVKVGIKFWQVYILHLPFDIFVCLFVNPSTKPPIITKPSPHMELEHMPNSIVCSGNDVTDDVIRRLSH